MALLSLLFITPASAALTAFVDRNPVALDESFTLTVESDSGASGKPDFSGLQNDFDLMGQSSNSSIQIINGQMSRKQQWRVGLMAKRAGEIQIPPFEVGGERSQPLTLKVTEARQPQAAQEQSDLFFEVSAAPQKLHVQQQLIYTVRLYYGVNLGDGNTLSEPKVQGGDAIIEKLGDSRQYQTTVNGRRYGVLEQKYAIFPQKSGPLTIEPLIFEGSVVEQGRSRGGFFDPFGTLNQTTRRVRIRSQEVRLDVQPVPAGITAQWLPARNVQLMEQWPEDPPTFVVGEPVTRTLAVMADGLAASQLPAIGTDLPDGVKSYPDQPQLKDTKDGKGITGLRQQKIALIPTQPGPLILPAIEVGWWNTEKKRLEIARLPSRTVTVAPGSGAAAAAPMIATPPARIAGQGQIEEMADSAVATAPTAAAAGWWPWLSLLLGTAWLLTLIAWWRQRRPATPQHHSAPSAAPPLRALEQQLKEACQRNDPRHCKAALLDWAKGRWPESPALSLPAIASRCPFPLAEALNSLDRVLYAGTEGEWRGAQLWQLFELHKPVDVVAEAEKRGEGLEPLYRV